MGICLFSLSGLLLVVNWLSLSTPKKYLFLGVFLWGDLFGWFCIPHRFDNG